MLRELHITNLAVIADLTVEFAPGLNCFTGQTGAGKSLIIGALEMLLGMRQPQDMLRKSAEGAKGAGKEGGKEGGVEGRVTAVFHIANKALREQIAGVTDLPLVDEPELIIARRIHESGRTSASVNGHPITGAMLKAVGEALVDVHGQHDAQYLLKPMNQLRVIDDFGGSGELRETFAELFRRRQELVGQQKELTASRTLRRQQLELYEFQAAEIDEAQLGAGEQEKLEARHRLLGNLEKIKTRAGAAYGVLYEEEGAAVEKVKLIAAWLTELAELDDGLAPIAKQIGEAAMSLDDTAFSLRRHLDKLELDPAELSEAAERLNLINRMINKYGGPTSNIEEVLAYRQQIGGQIEELKKQDEDFSTLTEQITAVEKELRSVGAKLTAARQAAAKALVPRVHGQLADLGMKEARFAVEFQKLEGVVDAREVKQEARSIKHGGAEGAHGAAGKGAGMDFAEAAKLLVQDFTTASGLETVEFMIAPNPGQPARPLRRIASGGELSRVMLALKSILAQADRVSVLVFDEIDANVGGRMGTVIGEKLRDLSRVHQVLCITHLPQIAGYADRHLTIRKTTQGGESFTTVTVVDGEARVAELAEMIAGRETTATSLAQARELLELGQKKDDKRAPSAGSGAAKRPAVTRARRGK